MPPVHRLHIKEKTDSGEAAARTLTAGRHTTRHADVSEDVWLNAGGGTRPEDSRVVAGRSGAYTYTYMGRASQVSAA